MKLLIIWVWVLLRLCWAAGWVGKYWGLVLNFFNCYEDILIQFLFTIINYLGTATCSNPKFAREGVI